MFSLLRKSKFSSSIPSPEKGPVDDKAVLAAYPAIDQDLPEGGAAAWCTVLGAFLAQFGGYGYLNSFGVYQAYYSQRYLVNESASAVSWIGSLATFLGTGMGVVCGPLFDRGYFYHLWIGGAMLQSFSIFMLSLVNPGNYYQVLLAQGIAYGIGLGLMYVASFAVLSHYFKRWRPAMMSIVASGSALGGIVHPIILNKLLNTSIGFKTGVRISAGYVTALLFFSLVFVRPRYSALQHKTAELSFWKATKNCFAEKPSLFTIIGFTLFQIGFLYPFFYLPVDALRHGLSPSFSFYSIVIISAGNFLGRSLAGAALELVGIVDLTIITTVVCAILIIGMIWLGSMASFTVLGLLYGIFSGMAIAMLAPMLGLMSDPAELGARIGVGVAISGVGSLVGSPICGALLTSRYIWWRPALFSGAVLLVGAAFFLAVRFLLSRTTTTEKRAMDEGGGGDLERPRDKESSRVSG